MKKISIFFSFLLIFTFFFVGSSYAAENPPLPLAGVTEQYYHYFYYQAFSGDDYLRVIASNNPLEDGKAYKKHDTMFMYDLLNDSTNYNVYTYKIEDGVWIYKGLEECSASKIYEMSFKTIYETNINVYTSSTSSEIFFQKTPTLKTPTVEEMVAEEVPIMAEKVTQTMKIILLCGIGCLALLISLPLFGKVFRIFQVK